MYSVAAFLAGFLYATVVTSVVWASFLRDGVFSQSTLLKKGAENTA